MENNIQKQQEAMNKSKDPKMIHLYKDIWITRPAYWTMLIGIFLSIVISVTISIYSPYTTYKNLFIIVIYVLSFVLLFTILTYNVNCVQVGHCQKLAWILTIFYLIYAVILPIILATRLTNLTKAFKLLINPNGQSNKSVSIINSLSDTMKKTINSKKL